jgi:ATP-binding cassette subfamily F protein 3
MIRINNLNKAYGSQILFEDVSFTINAQEKIGLIGRNGSGKSTFINMLRDRDSQDGAIHIPETLVISSLEQHLDFEKNTLLEQVCTALPDSDQEWKAQSILMGLGFSQEDFSKAPKEFSSGFQIRIRLAEALVSEPHLLLLDEPTNYLDIVTLRWLERFLKTWRNAFILVTHDRHFMEEVVTYTIGIHRGIMRKLKGGPHKLMDQIKAEEEVYERTRVKQVKKQKKTEIFINTFRAGARSAGLVQSRIKSLEKQDIGKKLDKIPDIAFHFHAKPFQGDSLMKVFNLNFAYPEGPKLIRDFTLNVSSGDRIGIIGRNGKGKTTLLKLLSGHLEANSGKRKTHPELRIGYFGAESKEELHPDNSVLDELRKIPGAKEQEVRNLSGALLFTGDASKKKISKLSGGEKSRVCLGKTILNSTHLLFLDEPTNHLDMESCQAMTKALKEYQGTVIFVSHDEDMISALANKLVIFDKGIIKAEEKSYQEFLDTEGWSDEEDESVFLFKKKDSDTKKDYLERKEDKKRLRWIENRLKKLHSKIEKNEELRNENATALHEACDEKNTAQIKSLGVKAKELQELIDGFYTEMEELMTEEEGLKED